MQIKKKRGKVMINEVISNPGVLAVTGLFVFSLALALAVKYAKRQDEHHRH